MDMFRHGEGFTSHEQRLLDECLEDLVSIRGLFMLVSARAPVRSQNASYLAKKDGSSKTKLTRNFWPVEITRPDGKPQLITLSDKTEYVHQSADIGIGVPTNTTSWAGRLVVHEKGRKIETVQHPEIITWQTVEGTLPGDGWQLTKPEDVLHLVEGGVGALEQELTIYRLQRVTAELDQRMPPAKS